MTDNKPMDSVTSWWAAVQRNDRESLERLLDPDYMVIGGPGGRTVGRAAVLAEAARFGAEATIDDWAIRDPEIRVAGHHAVCSYRWSERGTHAGEPFEFAGYATDVLRWDGTGWSIRPDTSRSAPERIRRSP